MGYPALSIRPPQQIDPFEAEAKVENLRYLRNQLQQQQTMQPLQQEQAQNQLTIQRQQIHDMQTLQQLSPEFVTKNDQGQVTGYNWNGYIAKAAESAVSPQTLQQLQKANLEIQQSMQGLQKSQLENQAAVVSQAFQKLEGIRGITDPQQRAQAAQGALQWAAENGLKEAQTIDPARLATDEGLKQAEGLLGMHAQLLNDASKNAELAHTQAQTTELGAKLPGEQADAQQKVAQQQSYQQWAFNQQKAGKDSSFGAYQVAQKGREAGAEANARLGAEKNLEQFKYNLQMNAGNAGTGGPLPPAQEATVQAILDGRMAPPSSFALKTPYWQGIMGAVFSRDPQFSEQRAQLRKDFTVGKHSNEINAINTAMGHVGVLGDAIDALNNGNVKALNAIANQIGVQTGTNAATTFQTIVHRVGPELSKAYIGAGGSAGERGADEKDFDPSLSPQQLRANVAITAKLLRSKIGSLENQWNQNAPAGQNFEQRFITPEAQAQLDKWSPQGKVIYARDPQGNLHQAKEGTPLPKGWTLDNGGH